MDAPMPARYEVQRTVEYPPAGVRCALSTMRIALQPCTWRAFEPSHRANRRRALRTIIVRRFWTRSYGKPSPPMPGDAILDTRNNVISLLDDVLSLKGRA